MEQLFKQLLLARQYAVTVDTERGKDREIIYGSVKLW